MSPEDHERERREAEHPREGVTGEFLRPREDQRPKAPSSVTSAGYALHTGGVAEREESPMRWLGPRAAGLVLLAFGVLCVVATTRIPSAELGWSVEGPRFGPMVVSGAIVVLALVLLVRTVVARDVGFARFFAAEAEGTHWPTPIALVVLLVGYALLLDVLGYALATTVFVFLGAWLLGSDRPVRDVVVGVALGVLVALLFTQLLGVRLPTGPWGV